MGKPFDLAHQEGGALANGVLADVYIYNCFDNLIDRTWLLSIQRPLRCITDISYYLQHVLHGPCSPALRLGCRRNTNKRRNTSARCGGSGIKSSDRSMAAAMRLGIMLREVVREMHFSFSYSPTKIGWLTSSIALAASKLSAFPTLKVFVPADWRFINNSSSLPGFGHIVQYEKRRKAEQRLGWGLKRDHSCQYKSRR
ncbi:unnamed protein product [Periconia digitata]|uniref:Uncharacterized protein n=1 Tax=Periconia digitata TaxID=1303443 RepID=A0A9W4UIA8_9PLEO|nr:unnamed protein product [Periconia digitata]